MSRSPLFYLKIYMYFFIYLTSLHPAYLFPCYHPTHAEIWVRRAKLEVSSVITWLQLLMPSHSRLVTWSRWGQSTKVSCQKHAPAPCCAWLWHQMLRNDWEHRLYSAVGDHISSNIQMSTAYYDDASRLACKHHRCEWKMFVQLSNPCKIASVVHNAKLSCTNLASKLI